MLRMNELLVAALALSLGTGCSVPLVRAYTGSARALTETAHLAGKRPVVGYYHLNKIDGNWGYHFQTGRRNSPAFNAGGGPINVEVLPGAHSLEMSGSDLPPQQIEFVAQAGKSYEVKQGKDSVTLEADGHPVAAEVKRLPVYIEPPASGAAVLRQTKTKVQILLFSIDGRHSDKENFGGYWGFNSSWDGTFSVRLAPGDHELEFAAFPSGQLFLGEPQKATLHAEAGKTYSIKAATEDLGDGVVRAELTFVSN